MERWDVFDRDRRPTGQILQRGAEHDSSICQLVIHVCLFNDQGKLLIQRRSLNKKGYPGYWDFSVGGGVLAGETVREAARREVREELGIDVCVSEAAAVTLAFPGGFDDYFLVDWNGEIHDLKLQPEEVMDARWASCEEILSMVENETFAPFWPSFIQLLFDLHRHPGLSK